MPLVVTDSTCLIGLDRIDHLHLLPSVFPDIAAPPAVIEEFGRMLDWLTLRPVENGKLVAALRTQLGAGESEAIALAMEEAQVLVVLDDRKARRIAQALGVRTIGTLGLALRAKRQGVIPAVRPLLDALVAQRFYITRALYDEALRLAGEQD